LESVGFEEGDEAFKDSDRPESETRIVVTHDEEENSVDFLECESKFEHSVDEEEQIAEGVEVLCVKQTRGDASAGTYICESVSRDEYHVVVPSSDEPEKVRDPVEEIVRRKVGV